MRGLTSGLSMFQGRDVQWILMNVSQNPAKITPCAIIFKAVTCVSVGLASLEETVTVTSMTAFQVSISRLFCVFQFFLEIFCSATDDCCLTDTESYFIISYQKKKNKPKPQHCKTCMFKAVKTNLIQQLKVDHSVQTDSTSRSQILT